MWNMITSGEGLGSLYGLENFEGEVAEGQRGRLLLHLRASAPAEVASALQDKLVEAGVLDAEVIPSGNDVDIRYRKGFPFLPIIIGAIVGLIILAILIISWKFFKEVKEVVPQPILIIGIIVGIIFLAVITYYIFRRTRGGIV